MAFYKKPNPNLERLVALLGIAKPSHGYTVAEAGPEAITAPGVYFPAESGEVVPLKPSSIPGIPKPPTERSYGMLPEASKLGGSNFMWQKGNVRTTSRQAGGTVNPTAWDVRRRQGPGMWMGDIGEEPSVPSPPETPPSSYVYPDIPPNTLTPLRPAPTPTPPPASQEEQGILQRLLQLFSRQYGGRVYPPTLESEELEARNRWEQPGYAEEALRRARSEVSPTISSVSPGFERGYYEAHPEERIMEHIEASNKPAMDIMQRAIEDARTRAQGFGVGFPSGRYDRGKIGAGERMQQAEKELPGLAQNLSQLKGGETEATSRVIGALSKEPKTPTPHLVQTDQGPVWAYPPSPTSRGGVLPIGVTPPDKPMATEQLIRGDLRRKLNREPTEGEILNEIDRRKTEAEMGGIPALTAQISSQIPRGTKNEVALEGLSPEDANLVRGLAEYRTPFPGSFALKSPYWRRIIGRAEAYDPSFSAPEYQVRYRVRQDFTSGKAAQNIRSLNTAVAHLDTLSKKAEALNNAPTAFWNAIKNKTLTEVKGDKRVTEFNNAVSAVSSELATVFKGMGATDQEIKNWKGNINSSQSPEQLKGNIDTVIELMFGRLGALRSQYEAGMGQMKDFPILNTRSRTILEKLGADVNAVEPSVQTSGGGRSVVEKRQTKDGRVLVKYSDGKIEEEK